MQWEVRAEPADISIHALHEESDTTANAMLRMLKFQSTLSMRRATDEHHHAGADDRISIHALHEERDHLETSQIKAFGNFNPRSP